MCKSRFDPFLFFFLALQTSNLIPTFVFLFYALTTYDYGYMDPSISWRESLPEGVGVAGYGEGREA